MVCGKKTLKFSHRLDVPQPRTQLNALSSIILTAGLFGTGLVLPVIILTFLLHVKVAVSLMITKIAHSDWTNICSGKYYFTSPLHVKLVPSE